MQVINAWYYAPSQHTACKGTTGTPKAVIHTHFTAGAFVATIINLPKWKKIFEEEMNSELRMLALLPMFHIFGFAMTCGCLKLRGTLVTNPKFRPKLFFETIQVREVLTINICSI